jgi:hypothetical protein
MLVPFPEKRQTQNSDSRQLQNKFTVLRPKALLTVHRVTKQVNTSSIASTARATDSKAFRNPTAANKVSRKEERPLPSQQYGLLWKGQKNLLAKSNGCKPNKRQQRQTPKEVMSCSSYARITTTHHVESGRAHKVLHQYRPNLPSWRQDHCGHCSDLVIAY